MRLTFLGTGTSFGIPVVGCRCPTCTSPDPRDRRTRHGALVTGPGGRRLLVDTPPELRLQLLREGVEEIEAVWFTHYHADHVHGVDDLRVFTVRRRTRLRALAGSDCARALRRHFPYVFDEGVRPPEGTTAPRVRLERLEPGVPVEVLGVRFVPLVVPHGSMDVYGFRVGELGYVTDAKEIPDESLAVLQGVRILVLNALWTGPSHPTHFNVGEAVEAARVVGAERTYLTHLSHRVRHEELLDELPPGVEPAYDGLRVDFQA